MVTKFMNPKTGRKERHIQCKYCTAWIPESEYSSHNCKQQKQPNAFMNAW